MIFLTTSSSVIFLTLTALISSTRTFKREYMSLTRSFRFMTKLLIFLIKPSYRSFLTLLDPSWISSRAVHISCEVVHEQILLKTSFVIAPYRRFLAFAFALTRSSSSTVGAWGSTGGL